MSFRCSVSVLNASMEQRRDVAHGVRASALRKHVPGRSWSGRRRTTIPGCGAPCLSRSRPEIMTRLHPVGICKYDRDQAAPTLVLRHPTVEPCTIGDRRRWERTDRPRPPSNLSPPLRGIPHPTPGQILHLWGTSAFQAVERDAQNDAVDFGAAENAERRRNAPGSRAPLWIRPPHEFARYHAFEARLGVLLQATTPASGDS